MDGTALTYRMVREKVNRLASTLRELGVEPADRIAIVLPNGPEMALVFLAAVSAGCAAPLNPKYREPEFRFYMEDLKAKILIVPEVGHPEAEAAAGESMMKMSISGAMGSLELQASADDVETVAPNQAPTMSPSYSTHRAPHRVPRLSHCVTGTSSPLLRTSPTRSPSSRRIVH